MMIYAYLNTAMTIKGIKRTLRRIPIIKDLMSIIKKKSGQTKLLIMILRSIIPEQLF